MCMSGLCLTLLFFMHRKEKRKKTKNLVFIIMWMPLMQRPPWTIETVGLPLLVRSSGMLPVKCYWKLSKREDFHLLEAQLCI